MPNPLVRAGAWLGLTFVLLVPACGSERGAPSAGDGSPGGTFRWNEFSEPRSLDPARMGDIVSLHIGQQVFEGLVTYDFAGSRPRLVPALAESWTVSDDGLTWQFRLRQGVRFHDDLAFPGGAGREVTAGDVKASWERIADPATASTGWWAFQGRIEGVNAFHEGRAREVSGLRVLDLHTLEVRLTEPFAPFLHLLTLPYAFVVPPEAVAFYSDDIGRHPVGTGPFRLVRWESGRFLKLVRAEGYWRSDEEGRRLPYLSRAICSLISETEVEFLSFRRGELEAVQPISPHFWDRVFGADGRLRPEFQSYQAYRGPALYGQYFVYYLEAEPWRGNRALRQALNYAVNREALVSHIFPWYRPLGRLLPPPLQSGAGQISSYRYDPDLARALLAEAGYPHGQGLPPITLQVSAGGANQGIAEAVQAMLAEVGITVEIRILPFAQHLESIEHGRSPFFRSAWLADYLDPQSFFTLFYGKAWSPAGPNTSHYRNSAYDRLYDVALSTYEPAVRDSFYQEAEAILVRDAPALFLLGQDYVRLVQPYVHNYEPNMLDWRVLTHVWMDEQRPRAE